MFSAVTSAKMNFQAFFIGIIHMNDFIFVFFVVEKSSLFVYASKLNSNSNSKNRQTFSFHHQLSTQHLPRPHNLPHNKKTYKLIFIQH